MSSQPRLFEDPPAPPFAVPQVGDVHMCRFGLPVVRVQVQREIAMYDKKLGWRMEPPPPRWWKSPTKDWHFSAMHKDGWAMYIQTFHDGLSIDKHLRRVTADYEIEEP